MASLSRNQVAFPLCSRLSGLGEYLRTCRFVFRTILAGALTHKFNNCQLRCEQVGTECFERRVHETLLGLSWSEPHTSESPTQVSCRRPCANNYRKKRRRLQDFRPYLFRVVDQPSPVSEKADQLSQKSSVRSLKQDYYSRYSSDIRQHLSSSLRLALDLAVDKGALTWLTALLLDEYSFALHKSAFQDALALRYTVGFPFALLHSVPVEHPSLLSTLYLVLKVGYLLSDTMR